MYNVIRFLSVVFIFVALNSCTNNDAQRQFVNEAYAPAEGITEVDNQRNVISNDSDDWRVSPIYSGLVNIEPPYPNPVDYSNVAELVIDFNGAPLSSSVQLRFINFNGDPVLIDQQDVTGEFELISFRIDSRLFGNSVELAEGIHRLLIFDGAQRLITYGDIQIQ